jgi:hypothetical protein
MKIIMGHLRHNFSGRDIFQEIITEIIVDAYFKASKVIF